MTITEVKKKNGSIVYRTQVYLGMDRVTGKKIKKTITARTKKELRQRAKRAIIDFEKNGATVSKMVSIKTYKELADLWLETYRLTVKPQSYQQSISGLNKHILPVFGDMKLDKIQTHHIQKFINKLSSHYVQFGTIHSINRRILQLGVTMRLIPYNPARDVMLPKRKERASNAIKFIDKEHLKALMAYMEKLAKVKYGYYFDYMLYSVLLATGCRIGEAIALEWSDVDLELGTISIKKTYNPAIHALCTPKSKAGIRVISIDKKTVSMLKLYKVRQGQLFSECGGQSPAVVFATPTREYQSADIRQSALTNRLKELNIPRFTFHAFRHTHASLLLNAGIGYKELQYRLGHATLAMTMDTYSHLSKEKEREAVFYYEKAIENL
ncbi:tyrosine-type recombinase/integrase [Streptococcus sp. zg-JUN1979]|uniref:tyrosine-type recombinase/integrase n=1 Tax=Streptococcus sp. zg-JUN1979 TaxID=3391450 RepID=UPI0039A75D38